jgi:C-methyltransferase
VNTSSPSPQTVKSENFSNVWMNNVLAAAVELNLPEVVGDQPLSCLEIAQRAEADPDAVKRLLRALSANGFFSRSADWKFTHNEASLRLRHDAKSGMKSMLLLARHPCMVGAWDRLADGVKTGKSPFQLANGQDLYSFLAKHSDAASVFNEAMVAYTKEQVEALLECIPELRETTSILDIAGGVGQLLAAVLKVCPQASGAVFDLPSLAEPNRHYLAAQGLETRTQFIAGSFLDTIPEGFNLYVVKNALWNWKDDDVVKILRNVRRALGNHAKFMIIEPLITPENEAWSSLMDLQMMVAPEGRCRTLEEYKLLAGQSGLQFSRMIDAGETQAIELTA